MEVRTMSRYTTKVRFLCESLAGQTESLGFNNINQILTDAAPKVFDFKFPVFDEEYRLPLEIKILKHYYTREICEETVGLWKLRLDARMNEIMPYYNKLYESELIEFDPFNDTDLKTTSTRNTDGTSSDSGTNYSDQETSQTDKTVSEGSQNRTVKETGEGEENRKSNHSVTSNTTTSGKNSSESTDWDVYSDTPQGMLNNVDSYNYLTNARKTTHDGYGTDSSTTNVTSTDDITDNVGRSNENNTKDDSTTSGTVNYTSNGTVGITGGSENTGSFSNTEDYVQHVIGKSGGGSYSERLKELRDTFLNIDLMIINELSDLFFGLWE